MKKINVKNITQEGINKKDCMKMTVTYGESLKEYDFIRKAYRQNGYKEYAMIIEGQKIKYRFFGDNNFEIISHEQIYETSGRKRKNTSSTISSIENDWLEFKGKNKEKVNGEVRHEQYNNIKTCLEANIPVYLAGPAGSGKNHTVEQICKELNWDFYFSNSVQQEFKLTGFIDAGGKFHETEFFKACTSENDSVFFLDEMDASIPEVLVLLNAAIANGYFEFPTGRVNLNKVHFVAAGNTVGSGADEMYTGRLVLDQATLDRFAIIEFDYSLNIEMAITKNNSDLVNFIHNLRKCAEENGIRATFSYRCMTMVTKLEKANMDMKVILKIAVFKGLDKDTINTFSVMGHSKYEQAFREMKMVA